MGVAGVSPEGLRGFPPRVLSPSAHVKQQTIVNVVNTQHGNHQNRIDHDVLVTLNVLEQED